MTLEVPDDIQRALRVPEPERQPRLLVERGIARHYSEEDIAENLTYAGGQ